jgi:hypothetical protein
MHAIATPMSCYHAGGYATEHPYAAFLQLLLAA